MKLASSWILAFIYYDAWAEHPGASPDPVTYAPVDPDESVRTRAQEVLDQELAPR